MSKFIARFFYGMPDNGTPVNLNFTPIPQSKEAARGAEAYRQAAKFNEAFNQISEQLRY